MANMAWFLLPMLLRPHTTPLPLPRAYPVPRRHGAPDFDLQLCENALQLVKPEHIIVISAMSSI